MKRFAIKDYGEPQKVFTTIEDDLALPANKIRVKLAAFSINPYDISLRAGKMKEFRVLNFPYVLGNDGAGTVTEVGDEVTDFKLGDEVILHTFNGTYGEETIALPKKVVKKPKNMLWSEASGLVTPGITAYNLLFRLLDLPKNASVMVQGASGAVGSILVQLLKNNGYTVLASASSRNQEYLAALHVDQFTAYDKEDPAKVFADQADIVIDATKGGGGNQAGMAIMKEHGIFVALNQLPPLKERVKSGQYLSYSPKKEFSDAQALTALTALYNSNGLKINIAETLPFSIDSIITGHDKMEGHPPAGKIIIATKGALI